MKSQVHNPSEVLTKPGEVALPIATHLQTDSLPRQEPAMEVQRWPIEKTFLGKQMNRMQQAYTVQHRRSNLVLLCELLDKDYQPPQMTTSGADWEEVARWWPFDVLRQAAEEEDSEGCKTLLHFFLSELGVRLPKGVLTPFRGKRGRPKETESIYKAWIAQGRPRLTWRVCEDLARGFYALEFEQAKSDASLRQKLRNRIRVTILRHEVAVTKFGSIS